MKKILMSLVATLIFVVIAQSQNNSKIINEFVRVYNLENKKIAKGKILSLGDSVLVIKRQSKNISLNIKDIGKIKTKRSVGNNFLKGSLIGGSTLAILGASTADPDALIFNYTAGEGALVFGTLGALAGSVVGGISVAFKKSNTFYINGDIKLWQVLKKNLINLK